MEGTGGAVLMPGYSWLDWETNVVILIGAGTVLLLGLFSGYIKNRLFVSEPVICLVVGIVAGRLYFESAIAPDDVHRSGWVELFARITLAISVMGAALRLRPRYIERHWRELSVVLGPGMLLMWLGSAALVALLSPLTGLQALLVAAVLTPTDPVLSDAIVSSQAARNNIPERLRAALTAESGANDGFGLLLVMLPLLLLTEPAVQGMQQWILKVLLWEIGVAVALGVAVGWLGASLLVWVRRQPFSQGTSFLTVGVALALTVLTAVHLIGSDGILAVFAAGAAFNRIATVEAGEDREEVEKAIGRFFDLPVFILFGFILPWSSWVALGWTALLLPLAILALRRIPAWLLLRRFLPSLGNLRDTLFNGWFGPIGVAAMYYAALASRETGSDMVWTLASLTIAASILVHGVTGTPLSNRFEPLGNRGAEEKRNRGGWDT